MSGTLWQTVYDQPNDKMQSMVFGQGTLYRNTTVVSATSQNPQDWVWAVSMIYMPMPTAPAPVAITGQPIRVIAEAPAEAERDQEAPA